MMNIKTKGLLFSVLGIFCTTAVLGVGYSAWIYDNRREAEVKSGMVITNVLDAATTEKFFGRFDFSVPQLVVLDEGTSPTDLNTGINFYNKLVVDKGDSTLTGKDEFIMHSDVTIKFTANMTQNSEGQPVNPIPGFIASGVFSEKSIGFKIDIVGALADYLTFSPTYNFLKDDDGIITFEKWRLYSQPESHPSDLDANGVHTGNYTISIPNFSVFFQYAVDKKPNNHNKYEEINSAIAEAAADPDDKEKERARIVLTCIAGI